MAFSKGVAKVKPIPRFPSIQRDLSLIVDEGIRWADVVTAIKRAACSELEHVEFVDIYRGEAIDAGKKSVTLSLRFRDEDGTLTHETVDGREANILRSLSEGVGAQLRTG